MSATTTTLAEIRASAGPTPVIVFSKPACSQCNGTYQSLEKKGIRYVVVDVTADEEAFAHVVALGYSQMPVVETPTDHWSGHRIDKLISLKAQLTAA